jgi:hypothetical protein
LRSIRLSPLLLNLWQELLWNRSNLEIWTLLACQPIDNIEYLIPQTSLAQRSCSSRQCERPEDRKANDTDCTYSSFVHPALLTNHCQHTASCTLNCK